MEKNTHKFPWKFMFHLREIWRCLRAQAAFFLRLVYIWSLDNMILTEATAALGLSGSELKWNIVDLALRWGKEVGRYLNIASRSLPLSVYYLNIALSRWFFYCLSYDSDRGTCLWTFFFNESSKTLSFIIVVQLIMERYLHLWALQNV